MDCPVCSYRNFNTLPYCPGCGRPVQELEELQHLRYLRRRLESWQGQWTPATAAPLRAAAEEVRRDIDRLEARLGVAARGPGEATALPGRPLAPRPADTPVAAVQSRFVGTPLPERRPAPAQVTPAAPPRRVPPREPFSWAKVGEALLSRRTLQTLLYLGATLLVLSAIILVVQLWSDLHWVARQAVLLIGMATLFWAGYHVRNTMGLRLSGGALMDIGALWLPLNVGALLFEFLEVSGEATIPGVDVPLGLPMIGWMAIAAISTPIYAFLAYRFRLVLMVYGAAIGAGATLLTGLAALGAPLEWQLTSVLLLGPAYLWVASALKRRNFTELAGHLFWLAQAAQPALLVTVVALGGAAAGSQSPALSQTEGAVTVAAWATVLFYAVSFWLYRHPALEYLANIGLPIALLVTLSLHLTALPLAWYNLVLVGMAAAYAIAGKYLRKSPLWARSALIPMRRDEGSSDGTLAVAGVRVEPLYVVGLTMTIVAALWPVATVLSAMVSLYALVIVYGAAAWLFKQPALAYLAAALLFAPFALTIHWLDIGPHWRAMLFAPLAVACLAVAEIDAACNKEHRLPLGQLMFSLGAHGRTPLPKSLYAQPLFLVGYAATLVAMIFAATDLLHRTYSGQLAFTGAGPVPWTYLAVVGIYAASAYLRRSSVLVHLAALVFLAFALLLAERGFYIGWILERPDYALLLGGLSLAYLALGLVLDLVPGHYSKMLYLVGYALTVVGMVGTTGVKEYNLAMVGMSVAIYAASAYLVHRGGHPAFRWFIAQMLPDLPEDSLDKRTARGIFLYLATGLFPVAVLLAINLVEAPLAAPLSVAWYGVALTFIALLYISIAEVFRHGDPVYRYHWYIFGYSLSVIGPALTLADPTLRIFTIAISTARYAASAVITRHPEWVYAVAVLLPLLLVLSLERAGVSVGYYGVALLGLAVLYSAAGLVWRPDNRPFRRGLENLFVSPLGKGGIRGVAGAFTLPFLVVAFLISTAGIWLSSTESPTIMVASLSIAALYYLLATIALRETLLLYPVAGLLAAAYVVGLSLTGLDARYYGLALLPGVVVVLVVALVLEGYPDRYRPRRWFLPARFERSNPSLRSRAGVEMSRGPLSIWGKPMLPFCLVAYAGSVAVPVLSIENGWPFFWGLISATIIYGYSAWRFRAPLWGYPTLLTAHLAFVQLLFLLSPGISWSEVGASWIPVVFLMAALAAWAARAQSSAPFDGAPARNWVLPFAGFAVLGSAFSTALASSQTGTGLIAALTYGLPLAVSASLPLEREERADAYPAGARLGSPLRRRVITPQPQEGLAWATLVFLALALAHGLRLAQVPLLDSSIYAALAGLALVGLRLAAPIKVWELPLKVAAFLAMVLAPILGLVFWMAEGVGAKDLQPLVFTLAITGLALVGTSYLERRAWLAYLAVVLLEMSYMTQLVVFDTGQPQLFIIPAAIYLVAVAYLERRRQETDPPVSPLGKGGYRGVLETAGLALLLGVTLLQSLGLFTDGVNHQLYGLFLFFESLAVVLWGLAVRWKRPFFGGMAAFIANLVILLFDPLGEGPVSATVMWSVFGAVGTALVAGAVYLERNREKSAEAFRNLIDRLEAWD